MKEGAFLILYSITCTIARDIHFKDFPLESQDFLSEWMNSFFYAFLDGSDEFE
jgi:hypothetical protein